MNTLLSIIPKLPPVQQLAPGIIRILGQNPGPLTLQGTNSYLLGKGSLIKSRILIDTSDALSGSYVNNVVEVVKGLGKGLFVSDIILTHWHPDQVNAVSELQDALKSSTGISANIHKYPSNEKHNIVHFSCNSLSNKQLFDIPGLGPLEIVHTPGHTDDHICLFLTKKNVMFTGDLILGNGSTSTEYLNSYMKSLNLIKDMQDDIKTMYPAHGQIITEPMLKIQEYISHRIERISDVYNFLGTKNWASEREILYFIYQDVAEQLISRCLINQKQALIYLEKQNLVESEPITNKNEFENKYGLNKRWKRIPNSTYSFPVEFE